MKQILVILFLFLFLSTYAQKVGINTLSPEVELDIKSSIDDDPATLRISNPSKSRFLELFSGSITYPDPVILFPDNHSLIFASDQAGFSEWMRISPSGNIGIGITNPLAQLDIKGGDWNLGAGNPGDLRIGTSTNNFRIGIATGGGGAGITRMYTSSNLLQLGTMDQTAMTIDKKENVGIGTTGPKARLEVHSSGISDTLLLLNNQINNVGVDYGIHFEDQNSNPTVGAYIKADVAALIAETDCEGCYVIEATSNATMGSGRTIFGGSNSEDGIGVEGLNYDPDGTGVRGVIASTLSGLGIAVHGESFSTAGTGVLGEGNKTGVHGIGEFGVCAETHSSTGIGLEAINYSTVGTTEGVRATVNSSEGTGIIGVGPKRGVYGFSSAANSSGWALYGRATGQSGKGLYAEIISDNSSANAILAQSGGGASYAGYFLGRVHVNGNFSKSSGSFKIDHPQDPENKYLYHSFVESPDMMNIYNGNIKTDNQGYGIVELPEYFEALNIDFRYQLTVIGEFAQAIVGDKIADGKFTIRTDKPFVEVSWQVTGIRNDEYAKQNRINVEVEKEDENKGKYLNPEAFGLPSRLQIGGISESVKKECEIEAERLSKRDNKSILIKTDH